MNCAVLRCSASAVLRNLVGCSQVSALAKEIDVDRSIVTEWFKRFSKLPER
jgi:DNA-binding MarR family transcriptional regulator